MKEVIDCIPSIALRKYLSIHPMKLSVLQKATIVSEYAKRKKQIAILIMAILIIAPVIQDVSASKTVFITCCSTQRLRTWKITLIWREVT